MTTELTYWETVDAPSSPHRPQISKDMNGMESASDAMVEFAHTLTDRSQEESSIFCDFWNGNMTGYLPLVHA